MPKPKDMPDYYRVKYRLHGTDEWRYGIQERYTDEAENLWKKKGNLIIEDAITPKRYEINPKQCEIVPLEFKFGEDDEYDNFTTAEFEQAQKTSNKAKGLVGKLFDMPVADGMAWYVVTAETARTATVEWRGFCLDRWVDRTYGYGGKFPKKMIAREVGFRDGMQEFFKKASKSKKKKARKKKVSA